MTTRFTLRFVLFAFALTGLVSLSSVIAQETPETDAPAASAQEAVEVDPPPSDAKPADESDPEAPATEAPSDEPAPPEKASSADAPSADASPDADKPAADSEVYAKYQERLQEWKSVLLNLRDLDVKYSVAEESELEGLADQWTKEIERGKEMIPALRAAAFEAYRENPTRDRELEQFLVKMLIDEANRDASENAYELGKALIDNGVRTEKTLAAAGIGAYGVNEYDDAERYLKEAVSLATNRSAPSDDDDLLNRAQEYLLQIPSQRELWAEEQKFRAEEAEADDLPRVALETSKGTIVLELFENQAPNTVANFVSLVEKNFYDGLAFHRVLPHFMAQGGDPQGDGTGGPGYAIACEWPNDPNRSHFRGSLSMAHAGRDTGGSQFFLTFLPTPHLNDRHTVFGRVIEGFDVLSELRRIDPSSPVAGKEPDRILKAEVLRKRDHEYKPETLPERG